jgi:hypothetical protein
VTILIYAIGDLHLGFSTNKEMDVFGKHWVKHYEKIKKSWISSVKDNDLVLIAGDTSWAMSLDEAKVDIDFLKELPGRKLLVRGNHDYWWQSLTKMKKQYIDTNISFLQNDSFVYEDIVICGTRGWVCPCDKGYTFEDEKIYIREIQRLKLSLDQDRGNHNKIVMMHYPPMNEQLEPSGFTSLFQEYGIKKVIYGHVHGEESFKCAPQGVIDGVDYQLVSADFLNFQLYLLEL